MRLPMDPLPTVRRRLLPFLFLLYVASYLDRINLGFAALEMNRDVGLSPEAYGLGAGIFFISYVLLEVPSNLILERVGARIWIARIMVTWGVISSAMMFVRGPASFYTLRLLLGAAEAGFFPGIILYLTRWFPAADRARAVALFMTATALAGLVGAPVSGALLAMDGTAGLAGWQWLFLIAGLPSIILGVAVFLWLPDRPRDAAWLSPDERAWLEARVTEDDRAAALRGHSALGAALASGRVWRLGAIYFCLVFGLYGISFWLPQILHSLSRLSAVAITLLSAVPYAAAAAGMVIVARFADRRGRPATFVAVSACAGCVGFLGSVWMQDPFVALAALSLAALGVWSTFGPFWTIPASLLSGPAAAGGIALVNSVGNIGGFVGPAVIGALRARTTGFGAPLILLAGALAAAALLSLGVRSADLDRPQT